MTLHAKVAKPDLQWYPWKPNPIKYVEDKVFISVNFSFAFNKSRNAQVTFAENTQIKIKSFKKQKHWYLINTWADKAFVGCCCKPGVVIFTWESRIITLTVPLSRNLLVQWNAHCMHINFIIYIKFNIIYL